MRIIIINLINALTQENPPGLPLPVTKCTNILQLYEFGFKKIVLGRYIMRLVVPNVHSNFSTTFVEISLVEFAIFIY